MDVQIRRSHSTPWGTFGFLWINDFPRCMTLELPWKNNERNVSCIPQGIYDCVPHNGRRYKNVWRLEGVPDRTAILIHQGNTMFDIDGCILVGNKLGIVNGVPAILNSLVTLNALRATLPPRFKLHISGGY